MGTKIFLDTNVILDLLDSKRPHYLPSKSMFQKIEEGLLACYLSESIVCTTDYVLQKLFTKELRTSFFNQILLCCEILPCDSQIIKASVNSKYVDLEDVILCQIALKGGIDYFVTNDLKLIQFCKSIGLKAMSSSDFISSDI